MEMVSELAWLQELERKAPREKISHSLNEKHNESTDSRSSAWRTCRFTNEFLKFLWSFRILSSWALLKICIGNSLPCGRPMWRAEVSDRTRYHPLHAELWLESLRGETSVTLSEDEFKAKFGRSMGSCKGGIGVTWTCSRLQWFIRARAEGHWPRAFGSKRRFSQQLNSKLCLMLCWGLQELWQVPVQV